MKSNINHQTIERLVAEANNDSVQRLAVGAVIYQDNGFLLLERISSDFMGGLVELPSGGVETGEDLITALVREVQEETGLDVNSVLKYLTSFDYISNSKKMTRQFNFFVEVSTGEVRINPSEHQAYYFVAPADQKFNRLNISGAVRNILEHEMLSGV